uniref:Putative secreted protein n=1 Tax=Lutzomyia longipalpis TaxID=7200 RepID=A0A7G3ANK5_LUTLO
MIPSPKIYFLFFFFKLILRGRTSRGHLFFIPKQGIFLLFFFFNNILLQPLYCTCAEVRDANCHVFFFLFKNSSLFSTCEKKTVNRAQKAEYPTLSPIFFISSSSFFFLISGTPNKIFFHSFNIVLFVFLCEVSKGCFT